MRAAPGAPCRGLCRRARGPHNQERTRGGNMLCRRFGRTSRHASGWGFGGLPAPLPENLLCQGRARARSIGTVVRHTRGEPERTSCALPRKPPLRSPTAASALTNGRRRTSGIGILPGALLGREKRRCAGFLIHPASRFRRRARVTIRSVPVFSGRPTALSDPVHPGPTGGAAAAPAMRPLPGEGGPAVAACRREAA